MLGPPFQSVLRGVEEPPANSQGAASRALPSGILQTIRGRGLGRISGPWLVWTVVVDGAASMSQQQYGSGRLPLASGWPFPGQAQQTPLEWQQGAGALPEG